MERDMIELDADSIRLNSINNYSYGKRYDRA